MIDQIIRVYDKKDDNLIAMFTKDPPANPIDSMEMLIDPEVIINQNGDSIFKFQINLFSSKWKEINIIDYYFVVNNKKYTPLIEKPYVYDYDKKLISVELRETWIELDNSYVGAYNADPAIEYPDIHSVILLPKSEHPLIINGVRYDNNPYPRGSAGYNVWAILQGSGWELAYCDVMTEGFNPQEDYGAFNIESDNKSRLYNLNMIRGLYGGVFKWDSMNNSLYYFDESKQDSEFNKWKGYEIREGKNITKVTKTVDKAIVTKLEPLGYDGLNIKDVNDGIEYITNYEYTNREIHRILENKDLYDPDQLLFWGKRELEKRSKPRTLYNVKFQDFRMLPAHSLEEFDISDIVKIIMYDENHDEIIDYQRIISWNFKVFSLDDSNMECGDKMRDYVELLKQAYNKTDYNSSGNISTSNITHGNTKLPNYMDGLQNQINFNADEILSHANELAAHEYNIVLNAQNITLTAEYLDETTHALAQFKIDANSQFATIESLTLFEHTVSTEVDGLKTEITTTANTLIQQISNAEQAAINMSTDFTRQEIQNLNGELQSQITITSNTLIQQISNAEQAAITSSTNYTNQQISIVDNKIFTAQTTANTAINQIASANQAIINLEANYSVMNGNISNLTSSQASIKATADAAGASVSLLVSNYTSGSRAINAASIVTSVNSSGSQIMINANKIVLTAYSTTAQMTSAITASINGIELTVANGASSSTLTLKSGSTTLSSANITFTGIVTFANLSTSGQTTINGNNITTGTISANRIDLTSYSTTAQINATIDGMEFVVTNGASSSTLALRRGTTTISSANITFTGIVTFASLSTSGQSTINGNNITTGTISANRIDTSTLRLDTMYVGTTSTVAVTSSSTSLYLGGSSSSYDNFSYVYLQAKSNIYIGNGGSSYGSLTFNTYSKVIQSNGWSLGSSSARFETIYAKDIDVTNIAFSSSIGTSSKRIPYGYFNTIDITTLKIATLEATTVKASNITMTGDLQTNQLIAATIVSNSTLTLKTNSSSNAVIVAQSGGRVGFFGSSGYTKLTVSSLASGALLTTTAAKVNELIAALRQYGLIA